MPVKTRSQTKMENKNHLIACSVARDLVDEIITKIEEEQCEPKYFMTIWLNDDPNRDRGMGRWFGSKSDALKRFREIKKDLHSCLIQESLDDSGYMGVIFNWRNEEEECEYIYHEGKEYMLYETDELESKTTGDVLKVRQVYDDDCYHVGYWINNSIAFI